MSEKLRRWYNEVDAFFDGSALTETVRSSFSAASHNRTISAREAFTLCRPLAAELDRGARLTMIVAPDGSVRADGTSQRWEFFFDLPRRRAKLLSTWRLPWSEEADDFAGAVLDVEATPFPPPDGALSQMVREGKLLRRQLLGMWREEMQSRPPLPHRFRDSDETMAEFASQGLDVSQVEVTLRTEATPVPMWVADARDASFRTAFSSR